MIQVQKHLKFNVSIVFLLFLYSPAVDTPPLKPTDLGSLSWFLSQLWRSSHSTAFKKPLLGAGEQFYFFYRYVAALSSSALYELPRVFHCQIYYIQRNTGIPKLNSEHFVLSCSAASAMKQLCAAFQEMILP